MKKSLKRYWEIRGRNYKSNEGFMGNVLVKRIINDLAPKSLLDVGCGGGRLFSLYTKIPKVTAIDFSSSMLNNAKKLIQKKKYANITCVLLDASEISKLGQKFDLVVTRTVLLHIPPNKINQVVNQMKRVCKKNILILEYYSLKNKSLRSFHCFNHQYDALFKDLKLLVKEKVGKKTLFLFQRGTNR